jgi:HK97 family phage prohead protease
MTDTLYRSVATTLERTDRRTLEGLFMPWNVPAAVIDIDPVTGAPDRYREGFRSGAFDRQVTSPEPGVVRRIVLRDQHHDGLGKLGHVVALRNEDAGLHGVVSLLPSRVADVDALLDDEVTGLSCEFHPLGRPERDVEGTVWRTRAHLVAVALEAQPAYDGARVLAMRASDEIAALEAEEAATAKRELAELDEWLTSARDSVRRYVPTLSDDR